MSNSKVTIQGSPTPKIDEELKCLAEEWETDRWWLDPKYTPRLQWCFENRIAITALHSSSEETSIFQL
jgi:hypothetical protein